jgi:hypothetical protein
MKARASMYGGAAADAAIEAIASTITNHFKSRRTSAMVHWPARSHVRGEALALTVDGCGLTEGPGFGA